MVLACCQRGWTNLTEINNFYLLHGWVDVFMWDLGFSEQCCWRSSVLACEDIGPRSPLDPENEGTEIFQNIRICWCNYIVLCCTILEHSISYFIYLNVVYLIMLTVTSLLNSIKRTHKLITCTFICVLSRWSFYYERSYGSCKSSIGTIVITATVESKTEWIYVVTDIYIGASLLKMK